jgi:hypothetical protein
LKQKKLMKGMHMTRLMLATAAAAALVAGASAASAQTYRGGSGYDRYAYDRGWSEPGWNGGFVTAPVAGVGPGYGYSTGDWNYTRPTPYNSSAPRGGTYKMNAFKSQELLPQSPPEGGY